MSSQRHHDSSLSIRIESDLGATSPLPRPPVMVDLESQQPLPAMGSTASQQRARSAREAPSGKGRRFWLDGDALLCACPDCGAPMSVRLWLMIADCWQCGSGIELTDEEIREAEAVMQQARPAAKSRPARPQPKPKPAAPAKPISRARPSSPAAPPRQTTPPPRAPASPSPKHLRRRRRSWWREVPAWLVSLLIHLVALTLLGLLHVGERTDGPYITLSTSVSRQVRSGGDTVPIDPQRELAFDLPIPPEVDLSDPDLREVLLRADQEAKQLRLDPDVEQPHLAELEVVKEAIRRRDGAPAMLAARDPRIRTEMVRREGGTTLTEAAVARGLSWLARHQEDDGRWRLHAFHHHPGCTCTGRGVPSDSAATSLALLPFLGAGQTHLVGIYRDTVSRGLRWLLVLQKDNGDLRGDSTGNTGMYAHGQGAIVLCEAFLMTGDEALRVPAQKAIDFIVDAQHREGGWRYRPGEAGDTSVLGWQLMALQSARAARLDVPPETLELAGRYIDSVQSHGGSRYAYRPGQRATETMTAEALLCRIYLGWDLSRPGLREGARFLAREHPPSQKAPNFYYWYYASQTLHHVGGPDWDRWNEQLRRILIDTQCRRGHAAGSWDPRGPHASAGGRIYVTSLAVCTLEVYYRHLPLFRQIDLE